MIRVLMLVLGLGISISAAADLTKCLNLFTYSNSSEKYIYTSIHNSQKSVSVILKSNGADLIVGQAVLVGKEAGRQARVIASLDYTVKSDFLTISAARIPSDFAGEGVYRHLLEEVLADNPGVKIILTSLAGVFYQEYLANLAFVQNSSRLKLPPNDSNDTTSAQALRLGAVFAELSKLGFSELRSLAVLENLGGPFIRFSVTR